MERFLPLLKKLDDLRTADTPLILHRLVQVFLVLVPLGALMFSIMVWTALDGLALGDFFMCSLVELVVLGWLFLAFHILWSRSQDEGLAWSDLVELGGEFLALTYLAAGLCLLVSGFFPRAEVIFAFFGGFPFLGGLDPGAAGGILGLGISFGSAVFIYALLRLLTRLDTRD